MEGRKEEAAKVITRLLEEGTKAEQRWWEGLDEETKDLLKLLLAERMSYFSRRRAEVKAEQMEQERQQFREWRERLTSRYPGMEEDLDAFLDWLVSCQGNESEDAYLFGVKEGTRIMRMIYSF